MSGPEAKVGAALEAWLAALEARGAAPEVAAAVEPEVRIARATAGGEVVERIDGAENVARWLALTPPTLRFSLDGPARASATDEAGWEVDYAVEAEGFRNGGTWQLRLGPSGRIAALRHAPRPLGETATAEVRDTATWRTYLVPLEPHAHVHEPHDHAPHERCTTCDGGP